MLKGIQLTLLMGPVVPAPVPREVLDALTGVEVTITSGQASGFQLSFTLSNRSPLQTMLLLSGGNAIPGVRVVIVATVNGTPEVLMDGMMTHHEIKPGSDAEHALLTVTGADLSVVMDYIDFSGIPYPAMPREARVALILAKYAALGIAPLVIPSVMLDVPLPADRIDRHKGKDLSYVKNLAEEVGYVFYIEPGPKPGMSIAYWGPQIRVGAPQPALNINMDAHTNVDSLSFNFDNKKKQLPVVMVQNQVTKMPIPIPLPDITPLNPPLGLIPPLPLQIKRVKETAKLTPVQATLIGLAKAAQSSDTVTASGSLDVKRYGRVLKARRLVGVRGAGPAFDGLYYVTQVTHKVKRGEYQQDFTLARNGLLSTLPRVLP